MERNNECPKCGEPLVPNPSYYDIADCPKCDEGFQRDPKDCRIAALEKENEELKWSLKKCAELLAGKGGKTYESA